MASRKMDLMGLGLERYKRNMICDRCGIKMDRVNRDASIAQCPKCGVLEFIESLYTSKGQ